MRPPAPLAAVAVLAGLAGSCGGDEQAGPAGSSVVATTPVVADITREVAGPGVAVRGLLRPGADPHGYEPRPSEVQALSRADLVVRSGGEVDDWLSDALDAAGGGAVVATLGDSVRPLEGDPHWWQDPRNGAVAAKAAGEALARADPGSRARYRRRARGYAARLRRLDRSIAACVARIPAGARELVTAHDALGHYARRYGFESVGSVIPSRSSRAQPSARAIERLVDRTERERVRAIFPESGLDSRLEEAVARESGATVGRPLHVDTLGPAGSYIGSLQDNTEAIVEGLGAGRRCRPRA